MPAAWESGGAVWADARPRVFATAWIDCEVFEAKGLIVKKFLKLALVVAVIAAVAKLIVAEKAKWEGLTESEVREKLDARLPARMPDEKRAAVADKVVSKMQERGDLRADDEAPAPAPAGNGSAAAESDDSADAAADDDSDSSDSENNTEST